MLFLILFTVIASPSRYLIAQVLTCLYCMCCLHVWAAEWVDTSENFVPSEVMLQRSTNMKGNEEFSISSQLFVYPEGLQWNGLVYELSCKQPKRGERILAVV
jgi:hypothetical protein